MVIHFNCVMVSHLYAFHNLFVYTVTSFLPLLDFFFLHHLSPLTTFGSLKKTFLAAS